MSEEQNIEYEPNQSNQQPFENVNENPSPENSKLPETENMEVHKHPHHVTHKKKWGEYFLEFFMLFLAVFLGFVAENIREHSVERSREKEYMQSMIEDLREDTVSLDQTIFKSKQKKTEIDSLILLLNIPDIQKFGADLYYYGRKANRYSFFTSTDRTIQQMKNSGGFRLIRNKNAAKAILNYYAKMNALYLLQDNGYLQTNEYRINEMNLFNPHIYETMVNDSTNNEIIKPSANPELLSYDKITLLKTESHLHYILGTIRGLLIQYVVIKKNAVELIQLLQKEYHLD